MFQKILITAIIIYIPNSLHFPTSLGLPGLNVFNLLYLSLLYLYMSKNDKTTEKSPLSGVLKFYYLAAFIALLIGLSATDHVIENITIFKNVIIYSSLYFLIYDLVDDEQELIYYMKVVYFVVFMMGVEVLREKLAFGLGSSKRVAGAFGQDASAANYAGVFFAIYLPFLLKNYLNKSQLFTKPIFSLAIFMLGVFSIFYTYSRQAYGSILMTSVLAIAKRNKIILLFLTFLLFNSSLWLPQTVIDRIEGTQVETEQGEEQLDESTESRFVIWELAFENIILEYPQGIGLNEFQDTIEPYLPGWIHARDAHNSFVLILSENGILGITAFLLLLLKMYSTGRQIKINGVNEDVQMIGEGYQLIVIAVVLGNVYSSTFYSPEVMGNFWILSALFHKYYLVTSNNSSKNESVETSQSIVKTPNLYEPKDAKE